MPYCNQCGNKITSDYLLCAPCYKKRQGNGNGHTQLSEKERNYRFSMIKGRIAETLIQELFLSQGFNVYRYGMESTIPGITKLLKPDREGVSEHIKRMPDFVVQNPLNLEVYFVEVKYRSSGRFSKDDLPEDYPYRNSHLILVSKDDIQCVMVEDLMKGVIIEKGGEHQLSNRSEFALPQPIINEFRDFAKKMYRFL